MITSEEEAEYHGKEQAYCEEKQFRGPRPPERPLVQVTGH